MVSGPRGRNPWEEDVFEESFTPQAISDDMYGEMWVDEYPDYNTNFPTREMADRFDYGYGQHRPQYNEPFYNPEVMERQIGLNQFPGAASNAARIHNEYAQTGRQWASSPQEVRGITGWHNALKANPELIDPMYRDLYNFTGPQESVDMWKSKREQIEEARAQGIYGDYIANMMEDYGRDNPYLQELGGTFIGPRGEEEYRDEGYDIRLPNQIAGAYGANLDSNNWPYGVRPPSGRPGGMDFIPEEIIEPSFPNTPPPGWTPPAGPPPPPGVGEYPEPEITFPNTPPPGWTPKPPLGPPYIWGDEPEEGNWYDNIPWWLLPPPLGIGIETLLGGKNRINDMFGGTRE